MYSEAGAEDAEEEAEEEVEAEVEEDMLLLVAYVWLCKWVCVRAGQKQERRAGGAKENENGGAWSKTTRRRTRLFIIKTHSIAIQNSQGQDRHTQRLSGQGGASKARRAVAVVPFSQSV